MKNNPMYQNLRHAFWQRWTEQLYQEHEKICYYYGLSLLTPVIKIQDLKSLWGYWDPDAKCIMIASRLIEEYSWDFVCEILKHEMAHQIVFELFHSNDQHGPMFGKACKMLAVSDWAVKAYGDPDRPLPNWKEESLSDPNDRLLKRVENLLALATSDNEHEAALAMQRAQELCTKYNLDRIGRAEKTDHVCLIIDRKRKRIEHFESRICSLLNAYYFVRVIFAERFDAHSCQHYRVIEILGTKKNALMAEYVYYFLFKSLYSLWDAHRRATGVTARSKLSFMLGVLKGFESKLSRSFHNIVTEARVKTSSTGRPGQLVAIPDPELDAFVRERCPKLRTTYSGRRFHDSASFNAGEENGKQLTLNKAVTHTGSAQVHLLSD